MALKDAVTTILNRNAFYRDGYRLLLRIGLIQGVVIVLLMLSIISMLMTMETRYVYFATTSDGRIINIVPLNEQYRSHAEVITWAANTTLKVMRFNYSDYRQRLDESRTNFTSSGWAGFLKALGDARIIQAVEARKLLVSMSLEAAPEVKRKGVVNGVYTWELYFPISIKFEGAEAPQGMKAHLVLKIVRVSTLQNPDGISIEQWVTVNN